MNVKCKSCEHTGNSKEFTKFTVDKGYYMKCPACGVEFTREESLKAFAKIRGHT